MPAKFEKSKGDQTWFWLVVYTIGSRRIAMELVSKDTAFGAKHLLNVNNETAACRKDRRDLRVFDHEGPASAIYLFRNFSGRTSSMNTAIEYSSEAELRLMLAKVAEAFGAISTWPPAPQLQRQTIDFEKPCVHPESVGCKHKRYQNVELGAFLKGQTGNTVTIVIKHLYRAF
ncbi:MAG TPA: hypothetical protein VGV18_04935 [Verrucomicrobiae bacterium]|nr:hypothetical protein [Verrucomicrobiae bacterium]